MPNLEIRQGAVMQTIIAQMLPVVAAKITLKDEGSNVRWTVDLPSFRLSKFAITQEQYLLFSQSQMEYAENSQKPIVEISWLEAIHFCNLLSKKAGLAECYSWDSAGEPLCDWHANGFRLPSEAEWELACKAGDNTVRYGELNDIAWFVENSEAQLHKVGTKAPNAWGFYDMIGNVWEWCWDIYDSAVYGSYRVFRGGGWSDPARSCRASCRRKSHPSFRVDDLGFRLAQSI